MILWVFLRESLIYQINLLLTLYLLLMFITLDLNITSVLCIFKKHFQSFFCRRKVRDREKPTLCKILTFLFVVKNLSSE
jgi:hypothetical protein